MKNSRRMIPFSILALSLASFVLPGLLAPAAAQTAAQTDVPLQPLAQHVRRLADAMSYLGQPFGEEILNQVNAAVAMDDERDAAAELQKILDPFVLVTVDINAESRVKISQGEAAPVLVEKGTRLFLVKVVNAAGVTAPLVVESPNSGPVYLRSRGESEPAMDLTLQDVKERWADISMFNLPPMRERLSGLGVEYQILQVYSRDSGQRSAKLAFNVGQGTQDIGFRNDMLVVFNIEAAPAITLRVKDENGEPTIASFLVKDRLGRIYPNPSKRLEPDFPFQPQVYRADGEKLRLPVGYYTIEYSGGPEFYTRTKELPVEADGPDEISFQLQRWIDPSKYGWWSGDHHIHASGCSHYKNPTEGVQPEAMMRQLLGENLNIGAVLTWGPSWYYQKQFFNSEDNPLSKPERIMHYDVEVSGFPSSHAGHLVLLELTEDDYPGATRIEQWPSWDLPVLKWAKAQGAVTGFSHSGWGLEVHTDELPNYDMPGFDGIGANEYIVDVTHPNTIDFISLVDTPSIWELNIWYHTLNVGFRTRVSGETDFPCIYDDKVGLGRSYVKLDKLTYAGWVEGVRAGRTYVGDGRSHLIDFTVNGVEVGSGESEVALSEPGRIQVSVTAAAYLDAFPDPKFLGLAYDEKPYWHLERARVPQTREVPVELIVNGEAVATRNLLADGRVRELEFDAEIGQSSWVALRILQSSHTNPIFVVVDGKPIRASRRSAEWCLAAVNQCWTQKSPRIRESEREDARRAYEHARQVYRQRIAESAR